MVCRVMRGFQVNKVGKGRTEWHFVWVVCMAVTDDCMGILRVMYMVVVAWV